MSDFKPGTIAKATVRGVPDVRVWCDLSGGWTTPRQIAGTCFHQPHDVTDVRPLIVLDPTDPTIEKFLSIYKGANPAGAYAAEFALARMIEHQTRPAIEEPKGLGAVVEDDRGEEWVRTDATGADPTPWRKAGAVPVIAAWGAFHAVRVLSEGVK